MSGISKRFPGVQALQNADLRVRRGEIHGLVGENGAGKSTLIKVLAGIYSLDTGRVLLGSRQVDPLTPASIHEHGVRFIHQELNLVPHFTVAESVFMGQELRSGWLGLDKRRMLREAEAFLAQALNAKIAAHRLVRDLSVAEKKLVQIARALIDEQAGMVVFDEPTAPLAADEVEQVFKAIRSLKQRGISMIYVSHYLGEITEICDRVTVFRNGTDVAVLDKVDSGDTDAIIKAMVGREITELYPVKGHTPGKTRLKVENLGDGGKFSEVNFQVAGGEILGIAGLVGSGREELTDAIYGLRQITMGRLILEEQPTPIISPVKAVTNRLVLVPRDRRNDGLVLEMSLEDNINLASLSEVALAGMKRSGLARQRARQQIQKLDIRPTDSRTTVKLLSGGNQQKTVLARWLATRSRIFILDEPTVGVDIGARVEIYQLIEDLAAGGAAIIVSSSDPGELLGLCDRLIVMVRGELIADRAADELTLDSLLALTTCSDATPDHTHNSRVASCPPDTDITSSHTGNIRSRLRYLLIDKGPLILFGGLLLYLALFAPHFLDWQNLTTILRQSGPLAILCFGLAVVVMTGGDDIVSGGIDLSIPAASVMAAAICCVLLTKFGAGIPEALGLGMLAAIGVGLVNVFLVVGIGLSPLLATLANSVAVVGLTNLITTARRINVNNPFINAIRDDSWLGLPIAVLIMLVMFVLIALLMHSTPWGLRLQAVGGSRSAAEISGIKPAGYLAQSYLLASLAAAVASVTIIARGSGSSVGTEETLLVEMVLATFVGAAFSPRRAVTVWGALLGALLVNALSNGFALLRVDIFWIGGIKGALILMVVATAALQRSYIQR